MVSLDKKDRRILAKLDFNARATLTSVAKASRCSKQVAKYRIDQMLEKGIIRKIYAQIDYFRIGFSCYSVSVKLKNVTRTREQAIMEYITDMPETKVLFKQGGLFDFRFITYIPDTQGLGKMMRRINGKYGKYILHKQVAIEMRYTYFPYKFIHGKEHDPITLTVFTKRQPVVLRDLRILKALEKDARISNKELAQRLKVSAETVRRRIKGYEKQGIIKAYRLDLDAQLLGFQHMKLFVTLRICTQKRIEEFIRFLSSHTNVLYVSRTIEMSTLTVNVFVHNTDEFYKVVNEIKYNFPDIMEDFNWNVVFTDPRN